MTSPKSTADPGKVACKICLKEVPLSEAKNFEAEDYVAHFCGLECYALWKAKSDRQNKSEDSPQQD